MGKTLLGARCASGWYPTVRGAAGSGCQAPQARYAGLRHSKGVSAHATVRRSTNPTSANRRPAALTLTCQHRPPCRSMRSTSCRSRQPIGEQHRRASAMASAPPSSRHSAGAISEMPFIVPFIARLGMVGSDQPLAAEQCSVQRKLSSRGSGAGGIKQRTMREKQMRHQVIQKQIFFIESTNGTPRKCSGWTPHTHGGSFRA